MKYAEYTPSSPMMSAPVPRSLSCMLNSSEEVVFIPFTVTVAFTLSGGLGTEPAGNRACIDTSGAGPSATKIMYKILR